MTSICNAAAEENDLNLESAEAGLILVINSVVSTLPRLLHSRDSDKGPQGGDEIIEVLSTGSNAP